MDAPLCAEAIKKNIDVNFITAGGVVTCEGREEYRLRGVTKVSEMMSRFSILN